MQNKNVTWLGFIKHNFWNKNEIMPINYVDVSFLQQFPVKVTKGNIKYLKLIVTKKCTTL